MVEGGNGFVDGKLVEVGWGGCTREADRIEGGRGTFGVVECIREACAPGLYKPHKMSMCRIRRIVPNIPMAKVTRDDAECIIPCKVRSKSPTEGNLFLFINCPDEYWDDLNVHPNFRKLND